MLSAGCGGPEATRLSSPWGMEAAGVARAGRAGSVLDVQEPGEVWTCLYRGVCVCVHVHFAEPEQKIMYVHTSTSAREHLCKHLYHGKRIQVHKLNAQQHPEPCARGRRCAEGEPAGGLLYGLGTAITHVALGDGPSTSPGRQSCPLRYHKMGFPGGAVVENLPANAGDSGSSPGLGRSHMLRSD